MVSGKFKTLVIFYFSFLLLFSFSNSIIPAHFLNQGVTYSDMVLGQLLSFIPTIILVFALRGIGTKLSWRVAIVVYLIYIAFVVRIDSRIQFLIAKFLSGGIFFYYFLPYNIAHFELTPKENVGHSSAIMYSISPIIGVVTPVAAGLLANINSALLWIVTFIIGAASFYLVKNQENIKVRINILESLREIKTTRILIFLEGVWEAMIFTVIPIFTLLFIKTYLNYGIFISYLAAAGAIANLFFGRITDRIQKRSVFLYPVSIALGVITLFFFKAMDNIVLWIILAGLINLILPIFFNLTTAIVVDSSKNVTKGLPARELILAVGRSIGTLFVLLSLVFEPQPKLIFLVLSLAIFAYPLIMFWNSKVRKDDISYL